MMFKMMFFTVGCVGLVWLLRWFFSWGYGGGGLVFPASGVYTYRYRKTDHVTKADSLKGSDRRFLNESGRALFVNYMQEVNSYGR